MSRKLFPLGLPLDEPESGGKSSRSRWEPALTSHYFIEYMSLRTTTKAAQCLASRAMIPSESELIPRSIRAKRGMAGGESKNSKQWRFKDIQRQGEMKRCVLAASVSRFSTSKRLR